jgi:ADP-heptose:LPS heptosyltransferase
LVLRALGLGDLLTAVPALRALADAFPDHRRVLAAPAGLWPLVARIGPLPERSSRKRERAIEQLVPTPAWVGERARPSVAAALTMPRATTAVNLHGRGPDSDRLLLATSPDRLLAFRYAAVPETREGPPWPGPPVEHETDRWTRLLRHFGIEVDTAALDLPPPPLPDRLAFARGATVIHPGAASAARRWPAERWAAIARAELAEGRTVVVTGSAPERRLAAQVAAIARLHPSAVIAGTTDLLALTALIAVAGRVVCGDTGVAHLATALRTPSVVLFGPTDPRAWGPPADRPWHRALWHGDVGDPHADRPDAGLLAITPGEVLAALRTLPPAAPRALVG